MNNSITLPDFIIGGSGESGTSFLHQVVVQHPELFLPTKMIPETGFFNKREEFNKGSEYYSQHFFEFDKKEKYVGERTSGYMHTVDAPARIKALLPNVKLIFCLRNPIERAFSNYRFTCLQGLENLTFSEAIRCEKQRIDSYENEFWQDVAPFSYVDRGFYMTQINRYLKYFDKEQIYLSQSEQMRDDWLNIVQDIFKFLDVDDTFTPEFPLELNTVDVVSVTRQMELKQKYGSEMADLIEDIRLKKDHIKEDIKENLKTERVKMLDDDRSYLANLYEEEINELAIFTGWDLSSWK